VAKRREERARTATTGTRRGLLALALLVALATRVFWMVVVAPAPGIDFYQFWAVARAEASQGLANPYSDEARSGLAETGKRLVAAAPGSLRLAAAVEYREHIETFSTPFLYMVTGALSSADYDASLDRFALLRLVCLVAGVAVLCRLAGCDGWLTGLWLLTTLWFNEPVRSDARVGNVNALQLAGLAGYLALARAQIDRRQAAAGGALGLLIAFKPTLGLVAAFLALDWALRREWRRLALQGTSFALAGLAAVIASSAWFGSARVWLDWLDALPGLERVADVSVANGNFALARLAGELGAPLPSAAILAALSLALAACAWRGARAHSNPDPGARDYLMTGLGCAAAVVGVQLGWLHYFLLVVPLAIYLFHKLDDARELAAVGLASLLVLGTPLRALAPELAPHWQAAAYLAGALGLFALGLVELARARTPG
jgi:glycosyl transferase family 87